MEEQQRNIDEVFRESLGGYLEAPPGAAWHKLSRRLEEEDNGPRRRVFMRWPWVALSLLMIAGCAWMVAGISWHGDNMELNKHAANGDRSKNTYHQTTATTVTGQAPAVQEPKDIKTDEPQTANPSTSLKAARSYSKPKAAPQAAIQTAITEKATPATSVSAEVETAEANVTHPAVITTEIEKPQTQAFISAGVAQPAEKPIRRHRDKVAALAPIKCKKGILAMRVFAKRSGVLQKPQAILRPTSIAKAAPAPVVAKKTPAAHPAVKKAPAVLAAAAPSIKKEVWNKPKPGRVAPLAIAHKKWSGARTTPASTPKSLDAAGAPLRVYASVPPAEKVISAPLPPAAKPITIPASAQQNVVMPMPEAFLPEQSSSTAAIAVTDSAATLLPVNDPLRKRSNLPLSLAVLGGYEPGFGTSAPLRISAALRLLWQVSPKLSIGVQPALRYGNLQRNTLGPDGTYQRSAWRIDSFKTGDASPTISGSIDSIYNYVIHQIYDSIIVKGRSVGGSFWEVELPVIMRWNLTRNWSVWGGPSLIIGGKLRYADDDAPQVYFTERKDSIAQSMPAPAENFLNYFGTSTLPQYSSYKPLPEAEQASVLRLGYLAGVGYTKNRWLAEASLHQQLSGYNNVAQPARAAYSSPSVRLSLGYLLFSPKAQFVTKKPDE